MADATDLFRKGKSNFATTLASGISDSDTTIPLSSAVGLPTDTAVTLTIDRVDANGKSTPDDVERVTGVVSGTNLADCLRGEDGTTPSAHGAGAVVEMIWDGETWNDAVSGILAEHNQDGTHKINTFQHLYAPEGFLINGKIVPSVSSNNLTVAIKGLDGNDPSATNPVYVRIGDTIRTITSALSVTANAGTNWFNAGSAELATYEIDYFVYLGYNATDGVVIGFSLIPYGARYGNFSTTSTNDKYCAISNISHAASSDAYTVIGRFAATLSAGSGYTWSVPTFTNENLVQKPVTHTRLLEAKNSPTGLSSIAQQINRYTIANNNMLVFYDAGGTSNSTSFTFKLPLSSVISTSVRPTYKENNGVAGAPTRIEIDGNTATAFNGDLIGDWTSSGGKRVQGHCNIII